jgi:hypothetical protein
MPPRRTAPQAIRIFFVTARLLLVFREDTLGKEQSHEERSAGRI